MQLYGREWTRRELEMHVGRLEQVGGVRRFTGADGPEAGMDFIQVRTGAGLSYMVTPTKGLDISLAEYGGIPISWQSAGGDVHPMFYEPDGAGWLRTASGGLMMTCGLMHAGSPSTYEGRSYGLHGRAHHTPARHVCAEGNWAGEEYEMVIRGTVEESMLFGGHLRLRREIRSRLGHNAIRIIDRVENAGFEPVPHMMLYHFNFGYPLLSEHTAIRFPEGSTATGIGGAAREGHKGFQQPQSGIGESVYYHEPIGSDSASVTLTQPYFPQAGGAGVPVSVTLEWSAHTLPRLVQWKMPGAGVYALGLEPSNCGVEGRAAEAASRGIPMLQPGEEVMYTLGLNVEAFPGNNGTRDRIKDNGS
ncbi:DUF4432 family protein [Paenibacillus sp. 1P07SE]|uniref:DUF4432 family protein n=1 Tax=Paenibacillus sp. 1P07SE TaxID=3132209 RepID=UPI0039A61DD5